MALKVKSLKNTNHTECLKGRRSQAMFIDLYDWARGLAVVFENAPSRFGILYSQTRKELDKLTKGKSHGKRNK